jgi:hypothetical protein
MTACSLVECYWTFRRIEEQAKLLIYWCFLSTIFDNIRERSALSETSANFSQAIVCLSPGNCSEYKMFAVCSVTLSITPIVMPNNWMELLNETEKNEEDGRGLL